ncbi:DNA primase, partial [Acinetobacter baumannii]|nr:DNA primase [Acinetobacter baumannii]
YNGHNALGYVEIVMGEGAFDAMAIYQAFKEDEFLCNVGVVASFGKHLSVGGDESQMAELLKLKDEGLECVTIMWDGEPAAI